MAAGPARQTRHPPVRERRRCSGVGYRRDVALDVPRRSSAAATSPWPRANLTVTGTSDGLYVTAYPARTDSTGHLERQRRSPDQTVAAFGLVPPGPGATISLWPSRRTDAIVDVAGFFLGAPAAADAAVAPTEPDRSGARARCASFDEVINEFLAFGGFPGASVAVAKDGRIVYARSYGIADPADREPTRVEHHFRIASISKMMTAAAVQRLVAPGHPAPRSDRCGRCSIAKVPLPSDGRSPLPFDHHPPAAGAHLRHPGDSRSVLRRRRPSRVGAFGPAGPDDAARLRRRGSSAGPELGAPGTHYSYANVNFCLLGLVIEQVTGRPWTDVVRELVQTPARRRPTCTSGATYRRQATRRRPRHAGR